ncbi:MAG: hypothetical protein FWF57_05505 [Defluviitaleaceae bacterium]|nr:hypothetical protein [Defluviitaleaceae bacterium]
MKFFKKIVSTSLASVLIFGQVAFAANNDVSNNARNILLNAISNSSETTSVTMVGNVNFGAFVSMAGEEGEMYAEVSDLTLSSLVDLDERIFKVYASGLLNAMSINPDFEEEIGLNFGFFLNNGLLHLLNSEISENWILDEFSSINADEFWASFDSIENFTELQEMSLALQKDFLQLLDVRFSEFQLDGYDVIEIVLDENSLFELISTIYTVEFLEQFVVPFVAIEDVEFDILELESILEEILTALEGFLQMVEFNFVQTVFVNSQNSNIDGFEIALDVFVDTQIPFVGDLVVEAYLDAFFEIDNDPTNIVWPNVG